MDKYNFEEPKNHLTKKEEIEDKMKRFQNQFTDEDFLIFNDMLDEETKELFLDAIEQQDKMITKINKKYIPNKYKK